jgi:hypothetical protein
MTIRRDLAPGETLPPLEDAKPSFATSRAAAGDSTAGAARRQPHQHRERFATINAFIDSRMRGLPRVAIAVWVALWRDERRGVSRTSRKDLARRVGCDERSVSRAVTRLTRDGLLEVLRSGGLGRGVSTYRVKAG